MKRTSTSLSIASSTADDADELIQINDNVPEPRLVTTLKISEPVAGLTAFGDQLFLLRQRQEPTTSQIDVYNALSYLLQRHIAVPQLKWDGVVDLASCPYYQRLYVSDSAGRCVHSLDAEDAATRWSTGSEQPTSVSVTREHQVLVTCAAASRTLRLFSTHGTPLKDITLEPDLINPQHAVQLTTTGLFVVCRSGTRGSGPHGSHRVSLVDADGATVASWSRRGRVFDLRHAAADRGGTVYVADHRNRRVLLLDGAMKLARFVEACQDDARPVKLSVDVDRGRLYVAETIGDPKETGGWWWMKWRQTQRATGCVRVFQLAASN